MMLIHILVLIVLMTIFVYYINMYNSKTTERFITRKKGIEKLKTKISKISKMSFEKKVYKNIVRFLVKLKTKKTNTELLDIIYTHYKNHQDKEAFKTYITDRTSLLNENDNIDCKLFNKCDAPSNVCGALLSNMTKSMKETENCTRYKSILDDIKELVNEKGESNEE